MSTCSTCTHCGGSGRVSGFHRWSDGLGGVTESCPLCGGSGELSESLEQLVIRLRRELAQARNELTKTRLDAALFYYEEKNGGVSIPLVGASRPGAGIGRERIARIARALTPAD